MYRTVNDMLGDIVKVTPSSKMVGDLAIFMVQNDLTPENIVEKRRESLAFPDCCGQLLQGHDGPAAPAASPEDLQKRRAQGRGAHHLPPGRAAADPVDWDDARAPRSRSSAPMLTWRDVISYAMYPEGARGLLRARARSSAIIMRMGSHIFFNGMAVGETTKVNIEDGKTLVIKYLGLGDRQ